MRLIDADDFANRMYHEAFEKDSDLQKWDSGCWIRYKLFENVLREQPSAQPEIIRCKDCEHWRERKYLKTTKRYVHFCRFNAIYTEADDYCSKAERRTDE